MIDNLPQLPDDIRSNLDLLTFELREDEKNLHRLNQIKIFLASHFTSDPVFDQEELMRWHITSGEPKRHETGAVVGYGIVNRDYLELPYPEQRLWYSIKADRNEAQQWIKDFHQQLLDSDETELPDLIAVPLSVPQYGSIPPTLTNTKAVYKNLSLVAQSRTSWTNVEDVLTAAVSLIKHGTGSLPYPRMDYEPNQWWHEELSSITGCDTLTEDQYRAINVTRNFIHAVFAADNEKKTKSYFTGERLYNMVISRFENGTLPWHCVSETGIVAWNEAAKEINSWQLPVVHLNSPNEEVADILKAIANEEPINGNNVARARILMAAGRVRRGEQPLDTED